MAGMAAVFHGTGLLAAHDAEGDRLRAGRGVDVDAGCHHGDPHAALHRLVEGGAEDDVGLRIDLVADAVGRLVDLEEGEVHAAGDVDEDRSEEHTSELQSLMRISYAVFCLKKKKRYTKII